MGDEPCMMSANAGACREEDEARESLPAAAESGSSGSNGGESVFLKASFLTGAAFVSLFSEHLACMHSPRVRVVQWLRPPDIPK